MYEFIVMATAVAAVFFLIGAGAWLMDNYDAWITARLAAKRRRQALKRRDRERV